MKALLKEVPVAVDLPQLQCRQADWGAMTIESMTVRQTLDAAPFFRGLPEDRCQCPHWGYVIKGSLRFRFRDREEVFRAGEVYYAEAGHTVVFEQGTEYIEISPKEKLAETMRVVGSHLPQPAKAAA